MSREEVEDAAIAFLMRLDPAAQRAVLERFEEALDVGSDETVSTPRRLRRVARALREAKAVLGKSPSVREYKALRRDRRDEEWPDPRSVTRWLGVRTWNEALVRMRLEPLAEGDTIETSGGPHYEAEEVIRALHECAQDLGQPPTITDYLYWQRRPDVTERPGRRPASTWTFNRLFGGFRQARIAAGLVEGEPTAAHPSRALIRTVNYRVSDEQILDDIRLAASRVDEPVTATIYDHERTAIYEETKALGRPRALAGVGTIYRHFRSWPDALRRAGVDVPGREALRRGPRYSDRQILNALSHSYDAIGEPFTYARYASWRARELERGARQRVALPAFLTIYRRLGGWREAVERMHAWRNSD